MRAAARRLAAAPISWGVSEVPGWGHRMAPGRVLGEMRSLGLAATELGPPGYLPADGVALRELAASTGVRIVGGFLAAVLHRPERAAAALADVAAVAGTLAGTGARVLVVAAAGPRAGYETAGDMATSEWTELARNLERARDAAAARDVRIAFHPHVGSMVERREDVLRLLEVSPVDLCLDTGHLAVGRADPVAVAEAAAGRVAHVHLKDVDAGLAERVRDGRVGFAAAVRDGLFRPLGTGAVDVAGLIGALDLQGYDGWYVLEQDTTLDAEPAAGRGPMIDVGRSLAFMRGLPAGGSTA